MPRKRDFPLLHKTLHDRHNRVHEYVEVTRRYAMKLQDVYDIPPQGPQAQFHGIDRMLRIRNEQLGVAARVFWVAPDLRRHVDFIDDRPQSRSDGLFSTVVPRRVNEVDSQIYGLFDHVFDEGIIPSAP